MKAKTKIYLDRYRYFLYTLYNKNKKFNNCLFWALWKYFVAEKRRGYLAVRVSTHAHWFLIKIHILWHPPEPNGHFESFVPVKEDLGRFPPPLFKGRVVQGDEEYTKYLAKEETR